MTAVWGPMGWITLHSISANYPEIASNEDRSIVKKYLELFTETISCPSCKGHFSNMYKSYTMQYPNWADSRNNFVLFTIRAHNTVNKRLDKPRPSTVFECLATLREIVKNKSAPDYRNSYLAYLTNNWIREGGGEGMIQVGHVREMRKINDQYWNPRETNFSISVPEADILTPIAAVNRMISPFTNTVTYSQPNTPMLGFKLKGGRFSFGR
jgi:hypothetical protein